MTANRTVPSNFTGLSYAQETSIAVLPGTPNWYPLEPNDYKSFGADIKTKARNPINAGRQRLKGVVVDLDAAGGFTSDLTATNVQDIMQGFMFANFRTFDELAVTTVTGASNTYNVASGGAGLLVNDMVWAKNFPVAANNGLKKVASSTATTVVVDSAPTNDTTGIISVVGAHFASGDMQVSNPGGTYPSLINTTKDLTTLGLMVGQWIAIGGDGVNESFATAANNGLARVLSVAIHTIVLDKTSAVDATGAPTPMVTDNGAGKTIRIFWGRILINEVLRTNQIRRTYNLERTLGKADTADVNDQSEYAVGAVPNKLVLSAKTADILTVELDFVANDYQTRDATTGVKTGNRLTWPITDAFNSTSDFIRQALTVYSATNPNPVPLFGYLSDLVLTIDNGVKGQKAIKALGNFDSIPGTFQVDVSLTAFFVGVSSLAAIRANSDVSYDFTLSKNNVGITVDVPLLAISGGAADVKQDEAIKLPLKNAAGAGNKNNVNTNYTLLWQFWDYIPTKAAG